MDEDIKIFEKLIETENLSYTEFIKIKKKYKIGNDDIISYISLNVINKNIASKFMSKISIIKGIINGEYDQVISLQMFIDYIENFKKYIKYITITEKYYVNSKDNVVLIKIKFTTKYSISHFSSRNYFDEIKSKF